MSPRRKAFGGPPAAWLLGAALLVGLGVVLGRCNSAPEASVDEPPADDKVWTCAMHPSVRRDEPGACPLCGMDLIPAGGPALAPNEVALSERARALAGIRTWTVRRLAPEGARARLLGEIEVDETTLQTVTSWVGGRIERLHLAATGARVRRGQVVATLYSPALYAAEQDLIAAKRQRERLRAASEGAQRGSETALAAARQRLLLLGVPERELDAIAERSEPSHRASIRSPFAGTVIERVATEGAYLETGSPLYRLADLRRLWVQLEAYERDLPRIEVGQSASLEVTALPGERFEGRVAFVDPVVDPARRTARVRVALANPEGRLRPGMGVVATLHASESQQEVAGAGPLVVPASAPLFTGRRSVVYVALGHARYEAREVRLGPRIGDVFPVVAGLAEGDEVVIHGAFVLDADLQIRGGESMMTRGGDDAAGVFDDALSIDAAFHEALAPVVRAALEISQALAESDLAAATRSAASMVTSAATVAPADADASAAWTALAPLLQRHGTRLARASSLEAAREALEPLTGALERLLRVFGNPLDAPLRLAHCPMALGNVGAAWLQRGDEVENAYFGDAMRTCGSIEATLAPGAHLAADAPP